METKNFGIKSFNRYSRLRYDRELELEKPFDLFFLQKLAEEDGFQVELESLESSTGKAEIYKKIPRKYLARFLGETKFEKIADVDSNKITYELDAIPIIKEYGAKKLEWKEDKALDFILYAHS